MVSRLSLLVMVGVVFACGCGSSTSSVSAPSGSELERYAAEHPEVNQGNVEGEDGE